MTWDTTKYFSQENFDAAKIKSKQIAERCHLALREEAKDYGHVKEREEYSERFKDWSEYSDDILKTSIHLTNPMYVLWCGIRQRCYNEKSSSYCYYGGRGISMDPEWKDNFQKFAEDILANLGRKPEPFYSIDRIDGRGDYMLSNIRWVAPIKQSRNRRARIKITEKSGLILAFLYKYYDVTAFKLMKIYNDYIAEDDFHKLTGSWGQIYGPCRTYCQFV